MSSWDSFSQWFERLQRGERDAVQKLWERYFARLVALARKKLQNLPRRAANEEDVALSALDSFCRGAERGRFPRLDDPHDLWKVLVLITARKACDLKKYEGRAKRDWRRTEAARRDLASDESFFPELISREPDPAFAAQVAEQCQRLLDGLEEELRVIAVLKMEGHTNEEIKAILKRKQAEKGEKRACSLATVERKLALIRKIWEEKLQA